MKVVILYVFEGAQSEYHSRFKKKNKMADPIWPPLYHEIPTKTLYEDHNHAGSRFICFGG